MVNSAVAALFVLLVLASISCVNSSPSQPLVGGVPSEGVDEQVHDSQGVPTASNPSGEVFRNWASGFQAIVTIFAVLVGGLFAFRNRHLFRYGQPHLTISHEMSHRQVSPGYVQVAVTAILHNSSRVKVEVLDGLLVIQQMAPVSDTDAEEIFASTFIDNKYNGVLQWPTLSEVRLSWNQEDLLAEPGESVTATFEYIAPVYIEALLITTYFYNSSVMGKINDGTAPHEAEKKRRWWFWRQPGPRGWIRTTSHDIVKLRSPLDRETPGE